jgi:hypothetical protein
MALMLRLCNDANKKAAMPWLRRGGRRVGAHAATARAVHRRVPPLASVYPF